MDSPKMLPLTFPHAYYERMEGALCAWDAPLSMLRAVCQASYQPLSLNCFPPAIRNGG